MEQVTHVDELAAVVWPDDAVFIVDQIVARRHGWDLSPTVEVAAGEGLKTLAAIEALAEQVLSVRSTRPLTIVAVGGGSVGDAAGFLASTLWRGVSLWHVPTTLVAAADSAFGGKTAVNLPGRKNQLGTFWPADTVVLINELLAGMPPGVRAEGFAEVVKSLWLSGDDELALLDAGVDRLAVGEWSDVGADVMTTLLASTRLKRSIVAQDPREERGIRTLLNLGHTLAHAIELHDGFSHGTAVSWGLAAAGHLSATRGHLHAEEFGRLWRHVRPLLGTRMPTATLPELEAAMMADKKRVEGTLRSVLLRGPGEGFVTAEVTPSDWNEALIATRARAASPVAVSLVRPTRARIELEASKSAMNRLLAIAHLRRGRMSVEGASSADDVVTMTRALAELQEGSTRIFAGNGGTTFRFLTAICAARDVATTIDVGPQLARRPHEPLFAALRAAGGAVERVDETTFLVTPLPPGPVAVSVEASESSQHASALALISAAGRVVRLELDGEVVSAGYLEMTLAALEAAGVAVQRSEKGRVLELHPTPQLDEPHVARAELDASSRAVWIVGNALGLDIAVEPLADSLQPDAVVDAVIERLRAGAETIDLSGAPDLAPVLCAYAALVPGALRIVGAGHLRHKESNRIEELVKSFGGVGLELTATEDGLSIAAGVQAPTPDARFATFGDHRLAMAACLLATRAQIEIDDPTVVSKSYPGFWNDAVQAGFRINDRSGRFPGT